MGLRTSARHSELVRWGACVQERSLVEQIVTSSTRVGYGSLDLAVADGSEFHLEWAVPLGKVEGGGADEAGQSSGAEERVLHFGKMIV